MMIFDVNRYAQIYYQNIQPSPGNDYPRLKAWEFLYEYIWDESRPLWADLISEEHIDTTALHIGFYLANWGMFRGSSGLLQNSNLDLMKALAKCLFTGQGPELFELSLDNFAPGAPDLAYNQALLDRVLASMETLATNVSWTDTLKTKILMGVWGGVPGAGPFLHCGLPRSVPPPRIHHHRQREGADGVGGCGGATESFTPAVENGTPGTAVSYGAGDGHGVVSVRTWVVSRA